MTIPERRLAEVGHAILRNLDEGDIEDLIDYLTDEIDARKLGTWLDENFGREVVVEDEKP